MSCKQNAQILKLLHLQILESSIHPFCFLVFLYRITVSRCPSPVVTGQEVHPRQVTNPSCDLIETSGILNLSSNPTYISLVPGKKNRHAWKEGPSSGLNLLPSCCKATPRTTVLPGHPKMKIT